MDKRAPPLPPLLVVAAALVDADGRVLVQQRPPGRSLAGLWEFPGGKIEPGETPEAALRREIDEELGVAITADALTPIAFSTLGEGDRPLVLLLFGCARWAGTAMPLDAAALAWCVPDDLPALAMPPADVPLIAPLRRWISAA